MIKWSKAILLELVLYILFFVEMVLISLIGLTVTGYIIVYLAISPLIVLFCAHSYFNNRKFNIQEAFYLGLFWAISTLLLDSLFTTMVFKLPLIYEFLSWVIWFSLFEILIFTTFSGSLMKEVIRDIHAVKEKPSKKTVVKKQIRRTIKKPAKKTIAKKTKSKSNSVKKPAKKNKSTKKK